MKLKKTIENLILSAAIALTPAAANAGTETVLVGAPKHIQWMVDHKTEARAMVLGANVAFGCIKSGIGSYINDKGFASGCAKGALAGTVMYAGEHLATMGRPTANRESGTPIFGALGKLTHDLGVSMSDNVMRGEGMLSQYQTELGPATLTFKEGILPQVSFTITPAAAIIANIIAKHKLDLPLTIGYLTPVFKMGMKDAKYGQRPAYTIGNVISYAPRLSYMREVVLTHELNHTLFWSKLKFCGDALHPLPYAEQVEKWWNAGQDLCHLLQTMPQNLNFKAHYYIPSEIEAHAMERE